MRKGPNDYPLSGGFEMERLTRAKRFHKFGPSVGRYIKARFWRRMRRIVRLQITQEINQLT